MILDPLAIVLLGLAVGFAAGRGAQYTGACMGMAYAGGALRAPTALRLMVPLTFAGALLASGAVPAPVGTGILSPGRVGIAGAGLARGRASLDTGVLRSIRLGWAAGPASGAAVGFASALALRAAGLS